MKKLTLVVLALILANFVGYSQVSKRKFIVDLTGNYNESTYGSGVVTNNSGGEVKTLNTQLSIGYTLSESFVLGVGLEYAHGKELRSASFTNPDDFRIRESMDSKSNIYAPSLYLRYYKPIFEKFYFNLNLRASYGFVESEFDSFYATYNMVNFETAAYSQIGNYSNNYFGVSLQPEIQYLLSKRVGLVLNFGGFKYTNFEGGENEWNFSLKASNWNYGIVFSLGKDN